MKQERSARRELAWRAVSEQVGRLDKCAHRTSVLHEVAGGEIRRGLERGRFEGRGSHPSGRGHGRGRGTRHGRRRFFGGIGGRGGGDRRGHAAPARAEVSAHDGAGERAYNHARLDMSRSKLHISSFPFEFCVPQVKSILPFRSWHVVRPTVNRVRLGIVPYQCPILHRTLCCVPKST
jgi:hypothetical protein